MKIQLENGQIPTRYDLSGQMDISIPLQFNGLQPNAYGVEPAASSACEYGTLVGDVRRGGSCNFERYSFIPHCSGTHTECVGHITSERISVRDCLQDALVAARLVSVEPSAATDDNYSVEYQAGDQLITKAALAEALGRRPPTAGLVVRTLPNHDSKLTRTYDGTALPPYFTADAMSFITDAGFKHLLVDLPSVDRLFDDGKLLNHRIFWQVDPGSTEIRDDTRLTATISELVFVPDSVPDGDYLLNLQIAPFASDCAPSRPLLFPVSW